MRGRRQGRMQEETEKTHTILVIEDAPDMLQLMRRIFEEEGYHVELAADGAYGMDLLKKMKPDLVLLDIMMPGPDGYAILESIRQYSSVPVIMVTARRESEALQKALAMGADDYVKKPFRPNELLARVRVKLRRM